MIYHADALAVKENYKLLIGSIIPRPIAFVSTLSVENVLNLAPFSFFTAITSRPPTVCFASARKGNSGVKKDTLINIESSGDFVVNIVTEQISKQMHQTAGDFGPDIDEFALTGLTPVPSVIVKPPRVLESPINLECRLFKTVEIGDGLAGSGTLIIGEIVVYHIDDLLLNDGRIDPDRLKPVGKLAGTEYSTLGRRFNFG
jgi:flavin reductase (DIM6/NTAB) family NADH-FMN oxidoreductase RutF